jgi:hypothetical protein
MASDCLRIEPGDQFMVARDFDGFWAIRIINRAWADDDGWITVSTFSYDAEEQCRDLASKLTDLADRISTARETEGG